MNADQTLRATSDHGLSSLQAEAKRIGERLRLVNLKGFEIARDDPDAEILRRRRAWLQKRRARWNQVSSRRERAAIRQLPLREQLKHLVNIVEAVDRHGLPEAFDHWIPKTPGQHLRTEVSASIWHGQVGCFIAAGFQRDSDLCLGVARDRACSRNIWNFDQFKVRESACSSC